MAKTVTRKTTTRRNRKVISSWLSILKLRYFFMHTFLFCVHKYSTFAAF